MLSNSSLNLAEAGAEEALWALNNDDWSTWTESGSYAVKKVSNFDLGSSKTGTFSVVVEDYKSNPAILVEGRVQTPTGVESFRQLKIDLAGRSLFSNGLVAITQLTLGGGGQFPTSGSDKDKDSDKDGIFNDKDNDDDGDGILDDNDKDDDGNGILDVMEIDTDGDGFADAADSDDDGNGIADDLETDSDGDGIMNAFDDDDDGDGLTDDVDKDDDGNGIDDDLESDKDKDGIPDSNDLEDNQSEIGIMVDSYDSSKGAYDAFLNRGDQISVASPSAASGSVNINSSEIYGYIGTGGGTPDMDSGAQVHGVDTPVGTLVDSNRVTADFTSDYPNVSPPAMPSANTSLPAPDGTKTITIGTGGTQWAPEEYQLSNLDLIGQTTLLIDGPVILRIDGNFNTSGNSEIRLSSNGSAAIYLAGNADFGGSGIVNGTQAASNFVVYSTSTNPASQIRMRGNSDVFGAVYAPNSSIELVGNTDVFGSLVGNTITVSGNADFHYDEQLALFYNDSSSTTYGMKTWRELVQNSEQVDFESYFSP